jgi:hypothetical protein
MGEKNPVAAIDADLKLDAAALAKYKTALDSLTKRSKSLDKTATLLKSKEKDFSEAGE